MTVSAPFLLERLPPLPRPPHDATWIRLDARAGWRATVPPRQVEQEPAGLAFTLARTPAARRWFDEPSGSLGGLVAPSNVAVAGDTSAYLLDVARGRLRRFDPCTCAFEPVPCFGRQAGGARELRDARAIAIDAASLYVADAGAGGAGGRVLVLTLPELALRVIWSLSPAPPTRPQPWRPIAIAADGRGAIWVADVANAMVHRFDRFGTLRQSVAGMGGVRQLGVDCHGRVYVVLDGEAGAFVLRRDGAPIGRAADPETLRSRFPRLPFTVHADGRLDLGARCAAPRTAWFDLAGDPAQPPLAAGVARYEREGEFIAGPLDSRLHRCQWHRVVVRADLPEGTSLTIGTWTAEAPPPAGDVAALPESAWATRLAMMPRRSGEWDALVRSGPGRYLWLRVSLAGDGTATPRLHDVRVEFPRVSLREYLPAVWSEDTLAADFADRFLAVFDAGFRDVERRLDTQAELYDPLSMPSALLPWIASWIGATLSRQWPERTRRLFLARAARFFERLGTRAGLRDQLLFFLGMERCGGDECPGDAPRVTRCTPRVGPCGEPVTQRYAWQPPPLILEHYQLRRWLFVGAGRLGDQAVLWGQGIVNRSQLATAGAAAREQHGAQVGVTQLVTTPDPLRDPFHVYAHRFTVFAPAARACTPERRQALRGVIAAAAPAHTQWNLELVEPRFRIGVQAAIGLDSVVGRYPSGVTLGGTVAGEPLPGTSLGGASVLPTGPADAARRPRIGTTAHL
jgi:phage tail-like protein